MRFRNLSITQKLLVINVVSTLVAVLIAGGYWALRNAESYRDYLEQRIDTQAAMVASNVSAAVMFSDWEEVSLILNALAIDDAVLSANITQYSSGRVQSINFKDPNKYSAQRGWFTTTDYGVKMLETPIIVGATEVAKLGVVYHDLSVRQTFWRGCMILSVVCLLSMVVAALLSLRLQVYVTRPILQLTKLARRVTDTENYALRSPRYYPDEIGALTKDFNTMLSIIELRDQNLEAQVQRRSVELAQRNVQLEQQIRQREDADKARKVSEAGFEQVFLSAPIGMALLGANRLVMRANAEFHATLGLTSSDRVLFDDCVADTDIASLRQQFLTLVRGEAEYIRQELGCYTKSGDYLYCVIHCSAVRDAADKFRYVVLQLQDVTESRKLSESLEYQASHDALTGLANRWVLNQALADAYSDTNTSAHTLCVLDLDQFKVVNDTCGHLAGDELLKQVAELIKTTAADSLVARLGGDEFALLMLDCGASEARIRIERVRQAIEDIEFCWLEQRFKIGASFGAISTDSFTGDISELLRQADAACFVAKEQGRNRIHIIDGDDREVLQHQGEMRWLPRIHAAIANDHFELFAQPLFCLSSMDIQPSYEVLLRLNGPEGGGYVLPSAFLPAAERYGVSGQIDRWVVARLLAQLAEAPQLFADGAEYWINLSGLSLGDSQFLGFLTDALHRAGLPQGVINFEITETAVMRNLTEARSAITALKALGCRFALDDFGAGSASFEYLKQLPVDVVKIDGSFVRDIVSDTVDHIFVKSIIDIARVMDIETVAEFVETDSIFREIAVLNADYAQGYFIGKPSPLADLR